MSTRSSFIAILFVVFTTANAFSQNLDSIDLIISGKDLDLSNVELVTIPMHGPYMLAGNKLVALTEGNDIAEIVLPDSMMVDDFIWTDSTFIVKSGYAIYTLDKITEPLMVFDSYDYDIFPKDKKHLYIVSHQGDSSLLFLANMKVKRAKRLLTLGEEIVCVSALGEATMVVTRENIYLFKGKECTRCLNLWTPLRTAVMTRNGLVFATDNEICLLTDIDQFLLMFEAQAKKLLYDGHYLYIQLTEGDLVRVKS